MEADPCPACHADRKGKDHACTLPHRDLERAVAPLEERIRGLETAARALLQTAEWKWEQIPVAMRERCDKLRAALAPEAEPIGEESFRMHPEGKP